jgi:hypothetical protein
LLNSDPPSWDVIFEDDSHASSKSVSWANFSDCTQIDGVTVYLSRRNIFQITIASAYSIHSLLMEEPQSCFGFHRLRSRLAEDQAEWLYSAFGYATEENRIILQVTQTSGRMLIQKRSTPFVL